MPPEQSSFPLGIKLPTHPAFEAAQARAKDIIERASLNEAIRIIQGLRDEVSKMKIADRFNPDKKPSESEYIVQGMNPSWKDLNEPEFKRQSLLHDLEMIETEIASSIGRLNAIVMDIEATKLD